MDHAHGEDKLVEMEVEFLRETIGQGIDQRYILHTPPPCIHWISSRWDRVVLWIPDRHRQHWMVGQPPDQAGSWEDVGRCVKRSQENKGLPDLRGVLDRNGQPTRRGQSCR